MFVLPSNSSYPSRFFFLLPAVCVFLCSLIVSYVFLSSHLSPLGWWDERSLLVIRSQEQGTSAGGNVIKAHLWLWSLQKIYLFSHPHVAHGSLLFTCFLSFSPFIIFFVWWCVQLIYPSTTLTVSPSWQVLCPPDGETQTHPRGMESQSLSPELS